MVNKIASIAAFTLITLSVASLLQAQQPPSAIDKINEASVTETVKFLASDELAGRDTPSPGLDKASDFVAARFKAAGLKGLGHEGLGHEGSYFQTTSIQTIQAPPTASITIDGKPIKQTGVLGVLSANDAPFTYTGSIPVVDAKARKETKYTSPVSVIAPPFTKRRDANNFFRRLNRLRSQGATAILVQANSDHALATVAKAAAQPHLPAKNNNGPAGAVILIAPTDLSSDVSIELAALTTGKSEVKNVIGVLPGSDKELAKQAIIFSAHLDHIGVSGATGDTINNGADDDASGVTGVLTLADAYAALPTAPKRSVIFITFWGEEKGLLGSKHYAKTPAWPLNNTVANLNLEMLGRPEAGAHGKTWMTGWHQSNLGELMAAGAKDADVLVFEHPKFSSFLYRQSDNWPLAQAGVIAHSFSAGSLHEDYHQPTDEWEKLHLDHMTKVIRGLFAGSFPIANGEFTPKKKESRRPVR